MSIIYGTDAGTATICVDFGKLLTRWTWQRYPLFPCMFVAIYFGGSKILFWRWSSQLRYPVDGEALIRRQIEKMHRKRKYGEPQRCPPKTLLLT